MDRQESSNSIQIYNVGEALHNDEFSIRWRKRCVKTSLFLGIQLIQNCLAVVVARAQTSGPPPNAAIEKVRNRLEQLDEFEEGSVREEGDLTQGEYVARIEQLNAELVQAWNSDQKVKALKIAIQVIYCLVLYHNDLTCFPFSVLKASC